MSSRKTPNTGDAFQGKTPGQWAYHFCLGKHICPRCRARWVQANKVNCEPCAAAISANHAKRRRNSNPTLKRDKNPTMAEVVVVRELRSKSFALAIQTDMGTIAVLHRLDSVDIRDARHGNVKLLSFRKPREAKPATTRTKARKARVA